MSSNPERCCDLVMKGGITSGILYPSAIRQIANKFYFIGIAGTSAGAIAASVTAAAEYRRRQGDHSSFEELVGVSEELAEPGCLLSLFQADAPTEKAFKIFFKLMEGKGKFGLGRRILTKRGRRRLTEPIVDNGFGLCTGMANGRRNESEPPLTMWLSRTIDRIAGKTSGPLTFRDLHEAPIPDAIRPVLGETRRSIDFRAVTTNVTFGRPVEIPFRERIYAFDPVEWARFFPAYVVDHMVQAAEAIDAPSLKKDGKLPLPIADLPVVVAARMSLSFPLLFTMVPLWTIDYHMDDQPMDRVWFSDGGITSNFPMHRFDALYPRWPTLGINLQYTDKDGEPARRSLRRQQSLVYLPEDRRDGTRDLWNRFDGKDSAIGNLIGFAGSIFRSAQVWHDNAFLKLPGYRDRSTEIWLKPDEGGMNLAMPPEIIRNLVERGKEAGNRLAERFVDTPDSDAMSWAGHRWTRYRSGMAGMVESIIRFGRATRTAGAGGPKLEDLLSGAAKEPCYEMTSGSRQKAHDFTTKLLALADELEGLDPCARSDEELFRPFCDGPRPPSEFGNRARI